MNAVCLIVAGAIRATLPADEVTVSWTHSVEKTQWDERYRAEADGLRLIEARVEAAGAGMEPPPDAVFADGAWTWRPQNLLAEVVLADSAFGGEYRICYANRCRALNELLQPATTGPVTLRSCAGAITD